jgi:hypothetical protein
MGRHRFAFRLISHELAALCTAFFIPLPKSHSQA